MLTEPRDNKELATKKVKIQIVKEIPMQELREYYDKQTGYYIQFVTIEEFLTELANKK